MLVIASQNRSQLCTKMDFGSKADWLVPFHTAVSHKRMGPGNPVSATALNFNQHKAREQTPNRKWVPGVSGSGGHHIFTLLQETVGCEVVYLCRKWLKGSKLSAQME